MPTAAQRQKIEDTLREWGRYHVGNDLMDAVGVNPLDGLRDPRFKARLQLVDDEQMAELNDFLDIAREPEAPWGPGLRLFVSHIAQHVAQLMPLADALRPFGITPFLAHAIIEPGQHWHQVLLRALGSMDALLSFHSTGFRQSPWCGQEVGYALARNVPVMPIRAGEDPSGFISAIQAIPWNAQHVNDAQELVLRQLRHHPAARIKLGEALARQLKRSVSFDRTDFLARQLEASDGLSDDALHSIELALKFNNQVRGNAQVEALVGQEEQAV